MTEPTYPHADMRIHITYNSLMDGNKGTKNEYKKHVIELANAEINTQELDEKENLDQKIRTYNIIAKDNIEKIWTKRQYNPKDRPLWIKIGINAALMAEPQYFALDNKGKKIEVPHLQLSSNEIYSIMEKAIKEMD